MYRGYVRSLGHLDQVKEIVSLVNLVVEQGRLCLDVAHVFSVDFFSEAAQRNAAFIFEVEIVVGKSCYGGVIAQGS